MFGTGTARSPVTCTQRDAAAPHTRSCSPSEPKRSYTLRLEWRLRPPTTCVCAPLASSTVVIICLSLGDLNDYLSILSVFVLSKASSRKHAFVPHQRALKGSLLSWNGYHHCAVVQKHLPIRAMNQCVRCS